VTGLRVVSLVPSVTDTLLAWGVTPVACTRFCEQPELVHVGGTKDPDLAAIVALQPDVVVVCDEENRLADAEALSAAGVPVHSCSPRSVGDVVPALADLALAVGLEAQPPVGEPAEVVAREGSRRTFVPVWRRPWMTFNADTYGSSVLACLGLENVFGDAAERYPATTLEEVVAHAPDLILAPSEPYPFGPRHRSELEAVAPTLLVDGRDLFWWGVRTPTAVSRLAAVLDGFEWRQTGSS